MPSVEEYLTITANYLPVSVIGFVILIVLYSSCKVNPVATCVAPVRLSVPVGFTNTSTVVLPTLCTPISLKYSALLSFLVNTFDAYTVESGASFALNPIWILDPKTSYCIRFYNPYPIL